MPQFLCHRMPVTSFLLMTIGVTSAMTQQTKSSLPFRNTRGSRRMPSLADFNARYTHMYQVEKLKAQILRRLNLTAEPDPPSKKPPQAITSILQTPPPTPRKNTTTTTTNSATATTTRTARRNSIVPSAIIWSEPVGLMEPADDQLLFRVHNAKKKSDVINRVSLILRLRSKQHSRRNRLKRRKSRKGRAGRRKSKKLAMQGEFQNDGQTSNSNDDDTNNDNAITSSSNNSSGEKRSKGKRNRKGQRSQGRKKKRRGRRVKVLVQALNENSGRFKRIAVQRFTLDRKFSWIKLPIPPSLILGAKQSSNHTLVLRVKCKRCSKGRVSIDNARPRKKSRRKSSDLNPNRPYLVIQTADAPPANRPLAKPWPRRSKRDAGNLCPKLDQGRYDLNHACCAEPMTVNFKQLGWDSWIVHPEEFSTVVCHGVCKGASRSRRGCKTVEDAFATRRGEGNAERPNPTRNPSTSIFLSAMKVGIGGGGLAGSAQGVFKQPDKGQDPRCRPQDPSPLTIIYFSDQNTLRRETIPDLVSKSCACAQSV